MERRPRALAQSDTDFKELFGVRKEIFRQMLDVLTVARQERHKKGGRRPAHSRWETNCSRRYSIGGNIGP